MIYVSSSCIRKKHIGDVLEEYTQNDIVNIELSGGTEYYSEIERDLLEYKKNYNVDYVCHAYFPPPQEDFVVNLASCNEEIYQKSIAHYMNCIELLKKIDCHVLSIHAGFYVEVSPQQIGKEIEDTVIYDKEQALERFCEAYQKIEKAAAQYNITMYLENNVLSLANYEKWGHKNYLMMTDFDGFLEIRERLKFRLLLDVGHLYVSSHTLHKEFHEQCELFNEYVEWLHISQNNGIADEHKALEANSDIVCEAGKLWKPNRNITLETNASIDDIKRSREIILQMNKG